MAVRGVGGGPLLGGGLGLLAGLGGGACCILPLIAGTTGLFSVSLGEQFLAYRPWLAGASVFFLGLAWWQLVRNARIKCEDGDERCVGEGARRAGLPTAPTVLLSLITVVSLGVMGWSFLNTSAMTSPKQEVSAAEVGQGEPSTPQALSPEPVEIQQAYFRVEGMTCVSCATGLEFSLRRKPGVVDAEVDYEYARARVSYDAARTDPSEIARWIAETGYQGFVISREGWEQLAQVAKGDESEGVRDGE